MNHLKMGTVPLMMLWRDERMNDAMNKCGNTNTNQTNPERRRSSCLGESRTTFRSCSSAAISVPFLPPSIPSFLPSFIPSRVSSSQPGLLSLSSDHSFCKIPELDCREASTVRTCPRAPNTRAFISPHPPRSLSYFLF